MDKKFDLIVIGAGILGTFHAYYAALSGKKVLMLEKDARPVNASVRNFGMVIPSGMAGPWFGYGLTATDMYQSIQQRYDISVRNNGTVYIASDNDEQQLLHELKTHYDEKDYPSVLLTQSDIQRKYPALKESYAKEALLFPQEVSIEPNLLIHRLHEYIQAMFPNLDYKSSTVATDCSIEGSDVVVSTSAKNKYRAEKVVLSSGHEFKLLFPTLFTEQHLLVSKLQMLRTIAMPSLKLEGNIATGLSIRRYEAFRECPSYHSVKTPDQLLELEQWGIHILLKKAVDGTLIIGDSHEYAPINEFEKLGYQLNERINKLMISEAARIVDIDFSNLSESWVGYYGVNEKAEVFESSIEDKILITVGIGGKGMTCSAGYAKKNIASLFNLAMVY